MSFIVLKNSYNKNVLINTSMIQTGYETRNSNGETVTVLSFDDSGDTVTIKGTSLEVVPKLKDSK